MTFTTENNLRVVKTSTDLAEFQTAQRNSQEIIFEMIVPNERLFSKSTLFRHKVTGEFKWAESRISFVQYGKMQVLDEQEYEQVLTAGNYPRYVSLLRSWGAYILPPNVLVGERLFVEDLLQDVSKGNFWGTEIMASTREAIWDGNRLV